MPGQIYDSGLFYDEKWVNGLALAI